MAAGFARRTTAVLAVAAAVLCGCSDEQKPAETLPDASSSATTSSEVLPPLGPADFPVPDEAREKTPEGALEFTRYYIALGAHIASGPLDPQPLLDLSENCRQCQMIAASYGSDLAAGYRYMPITHSFAEAGPAIMRDPGAEVSFVYSQSALVVTDPNGVEVANRSSPATGELASGAQLIWDETRTCWIVTTLTIG